MLTEELKLLWGRLRLYGDQYTWQRNRPTIRVVQRGGYFTRSPRECMHSTLWRTHHVHQRAGIAGLW
jgi:hypothetical protein